MQGRHYIVFKGIKDVYVNFIEKGFDILKNGGLLSFIIPSAWLGGPAYIDLRLYLLKNQISTLVLLPYDVFPDAYVDTVISIFNNSSHYDEHSVRTYVFGKHDKLKSIELKDNQYNNVFQVDWLDLENQKFILDPDTIRLIKTLSKNCSLNIKDIALMKRGVLFDKSLLTDSEKSKKYYKYFEGNVYRYKINIITNFWIEFSDKMKEKPKDFIWFEGKRILLRRLVNRQQRLMAVLTDDTFITNKNLYSIITKDDNDIIVLLGILNSKLFSFIYLKQVTQATKDDFPQVTIKDILSLPYPDKSIIDNKKDKIVSLVDQMLSAQKDLHKAHTESDKKVFQQKVDLLDRQIDTLVYELYDMSEEEIRIVEGNPPGPL